MVTPSLMRLVISDLDACCRSSFQENGVEGLRSARKGDITDAMEKAYATWLTRLNQARTSIMPWGNGNSSIARRYLRHDLKAASSSAKRNLLGLRVIPLRPHMSSHSVAWWNAWGPRGGRHQCTLFFG